MTMHPVSGVFVIGSVIEWEDRCVPGMAVWTTGGFPCTGGVPWEYIILAANELKKDVWINIPITASSPFVKGANTSSEWAQGFAKSDLVLYCA